MLINETDLKATIVRLLKKVAPDTEPEKLQPNDNIRTTLEIDSFDYLQFIVSIDEEFGINTPEEDYGKIGTIASLEDYILHLKK